MMKMANKMAEKKLSEGKGRTIRKAARRINMLSKNAYDNNASGKKDVSIITVISFGLFIAVIIAAISSTGNAQLKACNPDGKSLCDAVISGSSVAYQNCIACGSDVKTCGVNQYTVDKKCQAGKCVSVAFQCPAAGSQAPGKIGEFTVYAATELNITPNPMKMANMAGRQSSFTITVDNKNPVALNVLLSVQADDGWTIDVPDYVDVGASSKKEFALKVTSPIDAIDGDYIIKLLAIGIGSDAAGTGKQFAGHATMIYQVASRAAPSISIDPTTQTGNPGQKLTYNVSVTNNDPLDFDAATIVLDVSVPDKWQADIGSKTLKVKPGITATSRLDITSDAKALQQQFEFTVNATANSLSTAAKAAYVVSLCGDGVCGDGEECFSDCPLETEFGCNGRCEQKTDIGVDFSASTGMSVSNFYICSKDSTQEQCKSDSSACGIGKNCLCKGMFDSSCSMRCVDNSGAYYIYATPMDSQQGTRSNANYSFECPYVNLDEIKNIRQNFYEIKQDFEQSRSELQEELNRAATGQAGKILPCFDGLGKIIALLKDHIAYMDNVIIFPAVSNTTEARQRSSDINSQIASLHDQYCAGTSGALKIISIEPPQATEKGTDAKSFVSVQNTAANINYFGYLACDFTAPDGKKIVKNTSCTPISYGRAEQFTLDIEPNSTGTWEMQCKVIGSLEEDCSSEVHDQSGILTFDVFTRDTFVRDVSGSCSNIGSTCTVRLSNNFDCAGCSIQGRECTKSSRTNDTTTFSCPNAIPGKYNLTGYIIPTPECNPVNPEDKTISVQCTGCGDGKVEGQEQCELPGTNNNANCGQTEVEIVQGVRGTRDKYGYCSQDCKCAIDPLNFNCVKGVESAECSDGETQNFSSQVNGVAGSCTQQCGPHCKFENCTPAETRQCLADRDCLAGETCVYGVCTLTSAEFAVTVRHSPAGPQAGQPVTIIAATNGDSVNIMVDGSLARTCGQGTCTYDQLFSIGLHNYFAIAYQGGKMLTDPPDGTKSFEVRGSALTVSVTHSPLSPRAGELVTFTATSSGNKIEIYVDGLKAFECQTQQCQYAQTFSAGQHNYFAVTEDDAGYRISDPQSGAKNFTVLGSGENLSYNATFNTTNTSIDISISYSPSDPQAGENVTFIAQSSVAVDSIDIYVDNFKRQSCTSAASCQYSQQLSTGVHEYYAIFEIGTSSGRTPTGEVFASSQLLASIQDASFADTAILGSNIAITISMQNPGLARYGQLQCVIRSPKQSRLASTNCFALPTMQSSQNIIFIANELGLWNISSCSLNVSARQDCIGSEQNDIETNLGTFTVMQPTDIFITSIRAPSSAVLGTTVAINSTLQNPMISSRFVKTTCRLRNPAGQEQTIESVCSGLLSNSTKSMPMQFNANALGAWKLLSCSSLSSQSADCTGGQNTQTLVLDKEIFVIKSDKLAITSSSVSSDNITIGDSVSVDVGVKNPTDSDKFMQTSCTFKTQQLANVINSTACSVIKKDEEIDAIVTIKPAFVGRWNITGCTVASSLDFDCSTSNVDDTTGQLGLLQINSVVTASDQGGTIANASAAKCEIARFNADCHFSDTSGRYTVSAEITWAGGDHAHVIIGDDEGAPIYDSISTVDKIVSNPGPISVRPVVHQRGDNNDDKVLCSLPAQTVICAAGNISSGPSVKVVRDMPKIGNPGAIPVALSIIPLDNVDDFTLTEYVVQDVAVSAISIKGNQTEVEMSNATFASLNSSKLLNGYSFNTALRQGKNITINYYANIATAGDYNFYFVMNVSGNATKGSNFNLFITTCNQTTQVWAVDPVSGQCSLYRTPCDKPDGWDYVESCPELNQTIVETTGGGDSTIAIIVIIIIMVIAFIAYRKRDEIRDFMSRIRNRGGDEELPSLEDRDM